jgi:hypothetical protein
MVTHSCNPSTQEAETGGWWIQTWWGPVSNLIKKERKYKWVFNLILGEENSLNKCHEWQQITHIHTHTHTILYNTYLRDLEIWNLEFLKLKSFTKLS